MKESLALALALTLFPIPILFAAWEVPPTGSNLASVAGGDFQKAHLILDKKCTFCHSAKRIEDALASGKDMLKIQHRMEQKGVALNANEKGVLGIFWDRTPLKKTK